jgi:hypothetical protein
MISILCVWLEKGNEPDFENRLGQYHLRYWVVETTDLPTLIFCAALHHPLPQAVLTCYDSQIL